MELLFELLKEYGPYVALAVCVAGLVQAMKKAFPKFFMRSQVGVRVIHFVPVVLGVLGGLLLPEETLREQLLMGGALGTVSHLIYKGVTLTVASKQKIADKIKERESLLPPDPEED